MGVAAIYDIHANLPALEAVLQDIRQANVERVDIPAQFILGNGDREVLALMAGAETDWYRSAAEPWQEPVRWTAQQLQTEHGASA
jgi:hypothetical protein